MKNKNVTFIYLKRSVKTIAKHPGVVSMFSLLKHFPEWRKYLVPNRNPVADKIPWLTFSAIDFLKKISHAGMNVFEYGSGGSTLFWASRVRHIISVEHDRSWFEKIQMEITKHSIANVDYILVEPESIADFEKRNYQIATDYISSDKNFAGKSFEAYAKVIDSFPDENLDIVVVDGRARPSCILHSIKKLKKGGYLVIDNSERKYYLAGFDFKGWRAWDFFGPVPYDYNFSKTSILRKP